MPCGCPNMVSEWTEVAKVIRVNPNLMCLCVTKQGNNISKTVNMLKSKLVLMLRDVMK